MCSAFALLRSGPHRSQQPRKRKNIQFERLGLPGGVKFKAAAVPETSSFVAPAASPRPLAKIAVSLVSGSGLISSAPLIVAPGYATRNRPLIRLLPLSPPTLRSRPPG